MTIEQQLQEANMSIIKKGDKVKTKKECGFIPKNAICHVLKVSDNNGILIQLGSSLMCVTLDNIELYK